MTQNETQSRDMRTPEKGKADYTPGRSYEQLQPSLLMSVGHGDAAFTYGRPSSKLSQKVIWLAIVLLIACLIMQGVHLLQHH